jgi:hypothetical protein
MRHVTVTVLTFHELARRKPFVLKLRSAERKTDDEAAEWTVPIRQVCGVPRAVTSALASEVSCVDQAGLRLRPHEIVETRDAMATPSRISTRRP